MTNNQAPPTIAVVGLGYVGLPLALAFGRRYPTIGFDIAETKLTAYREGVDPTGEMSPESFEKATQIEFCSDGAALARASVIVVSVPTPVTEARQPDLSPLTAACETIGRHLAAGTIVVFESTVYPGVTEEHCGPLLESASGLRRGTDFFLGYSPERINPGDKEHTLEKIIKVVAGENEEVLETLATIYGDVIDAGVYRAESIQVAEAAKVIENTQRDLNIALMNELAIIFNKLDIDTSAVLAAASTKWNFLPFRPGLVGGHCIGVDPYYLTYRAESLGYLPQVILAGRRINDGMGKYIAEETVKRMIRADIAVRGARVLILGLTFKENCADLRNTRVVDVIEELESFGVETIVCDPTCSAEEARAHYDLELTPLEKAQSIDAIVATVAHREFLSLPVETLADKLRKTPAPFADVKAAFNPAELQSHGFNVWRL